MKSTSISGLRGAGLFAALLAGVLAATWVPAALAGTVASRELGQPDFAHRASNTIDGEALSPGSTRVGVAVDTSATPNHLYVVDTQNNRVLGFSSVAALVNGASADLVIGQGDFFSTLPTYGSGLNNASATSLANPHGVAVDSAGNVYVADTGDSRVLVFSNPFVIKASTGQSAGFAAEATIGQVGDFSSDNCNTGGGAPTADTLCLPEDVALDHLDNLYVADAGNNRVVEYNAPITSGTFSANRVFGQLGSFIANVANNGGPSKDSLRSPTSVEIDKFNNLYVADFSNNRVLEYNTPLSVTAVAGSGDTTADHVWGQGGSFTTLTCDNGGVSASSLCAPAKIALDGSANLYISSFQDHRVLEYNEGANPPTNVSANRVFGQSTFTASGCNQGLLAPTAGTLCAPSGLATDLAGDLFILDADNNRALKYITPLTTSATPGSGDTTADVVLGQPNFTHGQVNLVDSSALNTPRQIAVDATNHIYVADTINNRVLGWRNASGFSNGAPADLVIGQADFLSAGINRTGASAPTGSTLWLPYGVAVDAAGNLYVADDLNNRVLAFSAPFTACNGVFPCIGGAASQVFGQASFTTGACNGGGASPTNATLCNPQQVTVDHFGSLYVADFGNNRVLEYDTPLTKTTVTGSGDTTADLVFGQGLTGAGAEFTTADCNHPSGTASANSLCGPFGVAVDPNNDLYISDSTNSRVLEYNETVSASTAPANVTANEVFGQAGSFLQKTCSAPSATSFCAPAGVAVDASGNLYLADRTDNRVLEYITPLTTSATPGSGDIIADVVWGQGGDFLTAGCNIDAVLPDAATLCGPYGVAADAAGNVYISDSGNNRITAYAPPFPPPGLQIPATSDGILYLQPAQVSFNPTAMGTRRKREVMLINGGIAPVHIRSISTGGDFSYTTNCGPVLPTNHTCKMQVTFSPLTRGDRGGAIVISDDARKSPHLIRLSGHGKKGRASR
jgi:sugar lactone lactonase YvrE